MIEEGQNKYLPRFLSLIQYKHFSEKLIGFTNVRDAVGNMTVDGLRGASISYNILNLPEEVCLGNEKVSYIYTSAGEKLATRVGSSLTCILENFML